eukprot:TRINITY_DN32005_c0_g1_i1.p1 TRINITY_DN32005_c0_g1~~TRINITY_DN32005_c0_g1_i1.p1  ORF type:complete len:815 (-),score=132.92 TRINITY_DN32005_c0_g1_i1:200-2644(-)
MAASGKGGNEGRVLLQQAVGAITDGRWDDLTHLLQSHAPQLQQARRRLEQQALERHRATAEAMRQDASNGRQADSSSPPVAAVTERFSLTSSIVRLVATVARWADRSPWPALIVSQIFVVAVFAPAFLYKGFIMDDAVGVAKNPNVVAKEFSWAELMRRDFWGLPMHGSGWTNKSFRPFTTLTFRWNYLLHGLDSSGFHATNVLLHVLTSLFVGRAAMTTLGLSGSWAVIASVMFGVHPVHTENVLYLVCRADILAALLGVMALNAYAAHVCRPPQIRSLWSACVAMPEQTAEMRSPVSAFSGAFGLLLSILLIIASGLCKESGFTLFAVLLLMELLDFLHLQDLASKTLQRLGKNTIRQIKIRVGLLVACTLFVFVVRFRHTGGTSLNMSPQDNPISFESSKKARMLSYALLHGFYTRILVWPQYLCYDYSLDAIPMVREFEDARLLLPLAVYLGLFVTIALFLCMPSKQRRSGLVALAVLVVTFFPASNILFPVGTVVGERLLYVPSIGFCLASVIAMQCYFQGASPIVLKSSPEEGPPPPRGVANGRTSQSNNRASVTRKENLVAWGSCIADRPEVFKRGFRVVSLVVVSTALLSLRTFLRVGDWESSDTLFIRDGAIQPRSSKVQFNLGITYMQTQEWDAAVEALLRCAWADPLSSLPFYRIGQIEILRGRYQSAEEFLDAALDKFGASLMVKDEEVFHDLAVAQFQNGKADAAESRLRVALQLNPEFGKAWNNLGCCMASRQNLQDAVRAVRKAVSVEPGNPQYWANLAVLSQHTGDPATAQSAMSNALQIWPEMPEHRDCAWEFAPAG